MKTLDYLHLDEMKLNRVLDALQHLLADFQVYYTNLRGLHWNIRGRGFFTLHEKFETLYNDTAEKIDEIAERILMLGATPENRFSEYLKVAKLPEVTGINCSDCAVKHILDSYKYLIGLEKEALKAAEEAHDVVTADMLTGYIAEQEKLVWMLVAFSTNNCNK
jgi:starvation-inducible DNA-binding protein